MLLQTAGADSPPTGTSRTNHGAYGLPGRDTSSNLQSMQKTAYAASSVIWVRPEPGIALTALLVLAIFYTHYFARAILLPVILRSCLLSFSPPWSKPLARLRIPEPLGAAAVVLALL